MRRTSPKSEIVRLLAPAAEIMEWAWQRMHWWIVTMAALYAVSGITVVRQDEVAVTLRWGHLVGAVPSQQQHGPGLLFALPKPIDEIVRVKIRRVAEITVTDLMPSAGRPEDAENATTLNPLTQGYALTGDQNVVHARVMVHYRVREPVAWAFYGPKSEDILRVETAAAMVRSLGELHVDRVLSEGREELIQTVTRRVQAALDNVHSGLELTSVELTDLAPPRSLVSDFSAVQSAYIDAESRKSEAQAFAAEAVPKAQADADRSLQTARADSEASLAKARGDAEAFLALRTEYRANTAVVRERLYWDAVDRAIVAAGAVRWIPPPTGRSYHGFRISISPSSKAGGPTDADIP